MLYRQLSSQYCKVDTSILFFQTCLSLCCHAMNF
uniref:Uncharacterized protein n=1 Tax=Rhizophora mucronata TaxID=61149 RepID=A0A2P2NZ16_RHIMU